MKIKKESLGNRMKIYEATTQNFLPRRTYSVIRIDGRAFHSFTKKIKCEKPFDKKLMDYMDSTAQYLCENIQGSQFAYVQSDEISILITDFEKVDTQSWFAGNVQKIVSVSSSLATAYFNINMNKIFNNFSIDYIATFDSRVFVIPDPVEVTNYFLWRLRDWERNSIQMLSRSLYSHKQLNGKNTKDMHEMLYQKNKNWAELPDYLKRGRLIVKNEENKWKIVPMYKFPEERTEFQKLIPIPGYN